MSKTLVGINNLIQVDQLAYANHIQFFFRLGRSTTDDFILFNPRRMSIDRMRNTAARMAMDYECDYLMFIDDDVLVPFTSYVQLKKSDKDIVAGITLVRSYPFYPMVFNFAEGRTNHYYTEYKDNADENGLVKCDAVGFSCCLIKVSLLRKLNPPYFVTGVTFTEDVYFCMKARKENSDTTIVANAMVETHHILGSQLIHPSNKDAVMLLEETECPSLKDKPNKERDRTKSYYEVNNIEIEEEEVTLP